MTAERKTATEPEQSPLKRLTSAPWFSDLAILIAFIGFMLVGGLLSDVFLTPRNPGRAFDDDPMLGPVKMLLEGDFCSWLYGQTLHLKPLRGVDAFRGTPGAVLLAVVERFLAISFFQAVYQLLHILDPLAG